MILREIPSEARTTLVEGYLRKEKFKITTILVALDCAREEIATWGATEKRYRMERAQWVARGTVQCAPSQGKHRFL